MLNIQYYLQMNPDVAAAVARGEITAEAHFNLFGKFENRAPSPFFDPELYAAANPDVAAAVQAGLLPSLYDHFTRHGQDEGRDASYFFDPQVYLAANPDVAAAIASGAIDSAWDHFLSYGQNEVRNTSQFFDMKAYLQANPDVAAAVQAGAFTAFDHFLNHGFQEGRSIGNGISLAQFANDSVAQAAIRNGDVEALMDRVAEVAPFLPTYSPPAGYVIPSNQPIPQNFTPVEGEYLVVPPGVVVPPGTELPDSFGPTEPGPGPDPGPGPGPAPDVLSGLDVDMYTANGALAGGFNSVAAAVAAAQSGYRIEVRDATSSYVGDLIIDVANLKINGFNSTIEGGVLFTASATGSSITGFTIDGTYDNPTTEGATIFVMASGVTIRNNNISSSDRDAAAGIITVGDLSGIRVTGNTIAGFEGYGAFFNPTSGTGAVVTGNTFEDNRYGVMFDTNGASQISGNTFNESGAADIGAWYTDGGVHNVNTVVGANTHNGDADNVRIISTNGNEVTGTPGDDYFFEFGTEANDTFHGGAGNDRIEAGLGDDTVYGDDGNDIIIGNGGADWLYGGNGNDQITGRGGVDNMWGEAGADTFIFNSEDSGDDIIHDFNIAEGDTLQFTLDWGDYTIADNGDGDAVITSESATMSVTLIGVSTSEYQGAFTVN